MKAEKESKSISRRGFIEKTGSAAFALTLSPCGHAGHLSDHPARFWVSLDGDKVACQLCPWQCQVESGRKGRCQARKNVDGRYISLIYGQIAAVHTDPIEKKPFYHFHPGEDAFSMATASCNLDCSFCQNWTLARQKPEDLFSVEYKPDQIVQTVRKAQIPIIAYTYNEPTIYNEFIVDTTELARDAGIKTVIISNGFINAEPLRNLCKLIDAYKVDLKSFSKEYYRDVVHGRLEPVLNTLVILKEEGIWTEIVYLVVPTLNDKVSEVREMACWIRDNLGVEVPLHFSRFVPMYRLKHLPPTPISTLEKLRQTALDAGLKYVYLGNVPGHEGGNTFCSGCGKVLIRRVGYQIFENHIQDGTCEYCQVSVPGVWDHKRIGL